MPDPAIPRFVGEGFVLRQADGEPVGRGLRDCFSYLFSRLRSL
ncbi:hypothetical protein [Stenotrophomonas sp. P5_B8]